MQSTQKKTIYKKIILTTIVLIIYFGIKILQKPISECSNLDIQVFNQDSIKDFNGTSEYKPIYIAYNGCVYDVTPGKDKFYGVEMEYNYLTGKDSSEELNIAGGGIIKNKYKVIGKYEE